MFIRFQNDSESRVYGTSTLAIKRVAVVGGLEGVSLVFPNFSETASMLSHNAMNGCINMSETMMLHLLSNVDIFNCYNIDLYFCRCYRKTTI